MSLCNYQCTCSLDRASCPARSWSWQKAWVEFFQLLSKPHLANLAWPAPYSSFSDLTWLQDHSSIERSRLQVEFSPPYPGCIVYGCLGHVFCCEWDASCDCWCLVRTQQAPSQCAAGYNSVGVFSEATQQGCDSEHSLRHAPSIIVSIHPWPLDDLCTLHWRWFRCSRCTYKVTVFCKKWRWNKYFR